MAQGSKSLQPPTREPVVDQSGIASLAWILFFSDVARGDLGKNWSPHFNGLGVVGEPTITGNLYHITDKLCYWSIRIVPATSTTSTAGTTYVSNFPLAMAQDGACLAVSGLLGSQAGMVDAQSNRIYVPGWGGVTVPLTIVGITEVR